VTYRCPMRFSPFPDELRDRYLAHLGVPDATDAPSLGVLRLLHGAQLDRVPYENIEIQLGRRTTIDPIESGARIVTGRGGYCYHLNGAFGALLASLGYDVTLARGAVPDADGDRLGNHLVLLVDIDGERWIADVGLGDGFRDPIPLRPGSIYQKPFDYELIHVGGPRWRFRHDPRSTIDGFDFDVTPVDLSAFTAKHDHLSTSSESPFVRVFVMQSRRADHTVVLRGCVFTRTDASGQTSEDVIEADAWFGLLAAEFGVKLDDADDRDVLCNRVSTAHHAWAAAAHP
jgi:N-hydroxyarylamine O-acetyltransferase